MNHSEALTRYIAAFVDELAKNGVTDVVISPGSRSTPLSLTFAEHPTIRHWMNLDERSAAFFALGMAKQQNKPVALVCTSGTAAANYFPAIVEAHYSRVPLLVLTADRPHELRDVGAPQAIEQINMYGDYVKWFHEMALPEGTEQMLKYVRSKAGRAVHTANDGNKSPVHLNFPLREPLIPDFNLDNLWGENDRPHYHHMTGHRSLSQQQVDQFLEEIKAYKNGLIVCGPQMDSELAEAVRSVSDKYNLPILADPLSQLRAGAHDKENIMECYDTILKSEKIRQQTKPDFIIRFGAMPVSKPYLLYLKAHPEIKQYIVEPFEGYREPTSFAVEFFYTDEKEFCLKLLQSTVEFSFEEKWLQAWKKANQTAKQYLTVYDDKQLHEGHVIGKLIDLIPDKSSIYIGNSMPVRDLDTFFMTTSKSIHVLGNRGANGIDGLVSSALGAAAHGDHITLVLGDLSFYHDLNGLLAGKQNNISLTVILINNNGGGIFSFLPQANEPKHFEVLFGTPLDIDFEKVTTMYGAHHQLASTWTEFEQAVEESYKQTGLNVVEVRTNRQDNLNWHRSVWSQIEQTLLDELEG